MVQLSCGARLSTHRIAKILRSDAQASFEDLMNQREGQSPISLTLLISFHLTKIQLSRSGQGHTRDHVEFAEPQQLANSLSGFPAETTIGINKSTTVRAKTMLGRTRPSLASTSRFPLMI
jgi:hypothetical protein